MMASRYRRCSVGHSRPFKAGHGPAAASSKNLVLRESHLSTRITRLLPMMTTPSTSPRTMAA
jgi:hypothetical protein